MIAVVFHRYIARKDQWRICCRCQQATFIYFEPVAPDEQELRLRVYFANTMAEETFDIDAVPDWVSRCFAGRGIERAEATR
ncbi:hypothetical protein AB0K52_15130 [Glycomyces sp. NPDC049804]|uniref:hypothetical protein n=1 Tax=Glycomyces sp. NPDC049804 TaxID=3154363 RepID=UPI0034422188